jgi:hypothetical protein
MLMQQIHLIQHDNVEELRAAYANLYKQVIVLLLKMQQEQILISNIKLG